MTKLYNDIICLADDKKKKGQGINSILTLMKEMIDFQEQVQKCIEAQDLAENKSKLEKFSENIESMYGELLDMARPAIRGGRAVDGTISPEVVQEEVIEEPSPEPLSGTSKVTRPKAPVI